jgi:hypothetical protein
MPYVIRRTDPAPRWFVAEPGSERSYTPAISRARKFKTRDEAEADCCGNERIEFVPWPESASLMSVP